MEDFPFDCHKIRFATIERPSKELKELLIVNGYKKTMKDSISWGETLWYHPDYIQLTVDEVENIAKLKATSKWR